MVLRWLIFETLALSVVSQLVFPDLEHDLDIEQTFVTDAELPPTNIKSNSTLCDDAVQQHSGYIQFASHSRFGNAKSYFFWLFESRQQVSSTADAPLIIWLTGGPGCSSQLALLSENGPCTVDADGSTLTTNPHSWNNNAHVMWVDQPAGTGFSKGPITDHDMDGVASDFHAFLQNFFGQLPQYRGCKLVITGESYAGHYVPAISYHIWAANKGIVADDERINFVGMAIGNGLVDPAEQYKHYPQMARDGGKSVGGSLAEGVITNAAECGVMEAAAEPCSLSCKACDDVGGVACTAAFIACNYAETVPYQLTGMNVYDMRIKCESPPLCYDFSNVAKFLNDAAVQEQIGAQDSWGSCNMLVNTVFKNDFMKSYHDKIPPMLEDGVPVLIYAGDVDYICNWLGNKAWTLKLEWSGSKGFSAAEDEAWDVNGSAAGRMRTYNNFQFLQVYQAGHMVPMDQPEAADKMITDFVARASHFRAGQQIV